MSLMWNTGRLINIGGVLSVPGLGETEEEGHSPVPASERSGDLIFFSSNKARNLSVLTLRNSVAVAEELGDLHVTGKHARWLFLCCLPPSQLPWL